MTSALASKTNGLGKAVAAGLIDTGGAGAGAFAVAGAGSGTAGSGRSTFAGGAPFAVCEGCAGGGAIEGRAGCGDGAGAGNIAGSGGGVAFTTGRATGTSSLVSVGASATCDHATNPMRAIAPAAEVAGIHLPNGPRRLGSTVVVRDSRDSRTATASGSALATVNAIVASSMTIPVRV